MRRGIGSACAAPSPQRLALEAAYLMSALRSEADVLQHDLLSALCQKRTLLPLDIWQLEAASRISPGPLIKKVIP